jgi:Ni,Fe-hydrogenase III large subunit
MQNWLKVKNAQVFALKDIPVHSLDYLRDDIVRFTKQGMRPVQFFGRLSDSNKEIIITAVLADDLSHYLLVSQAHAGYKKHYESMTPEAPCLHLFERELYEQTGIKPEGHPWLKPVRFEKSRPGQIYSYPFLKIEGDETHEVAVGPVHAGIIEPGHFRFLCHGEEVFHLEIQLGYQHRGIEKLLKGKNALSLSHLAESIAGDTVIGHVWAYALAVEALSKTTISQRTQAIRAIMLEMERIAVHLADLGGISADIGFLPGDAVYGRIRTAVINTTLMICGSRFGRGMIRPGGVLFDIEPSFKKQMSAILNKVEKDVYKINTLLLNSPGVMSRLDHTGTVSKETAEALGLVGLMAKMAGCGIDSRLSHPIGIYKNEPITPHKADTGDVFARVFIRISEITQSLRFINKFLNLGLPQGELFTKPGPPTPGHGVVTLIEGWRGEISHMVITNSSGAISSYKIVDPSFHNWFGLAQAVRGNGISDFPVCNKSFALSYCGHDL